MQYPKGVFIMPTREGGDMAIAPFMKVFDNSILRLSHKGLSVTAFGVLTMLQPYAETRRNTLKDRETDVTLTTREIADIVGMSRKQITKYLAELERHGVIEKQRFGKANVYKIKKWYCNRNRLLQEE